MSTFNCIATAAISPASNIAWDTIVPAANKRRDPRIWQLAHAAVAQLFTATAIRPASIISATALGALNETKNYLDGIFSDNLGSPRNFIASVHNSMAGKLAIDFSIKGPNLTVCDGPNSFASALQCAAMLDDCDFPILVVAVDEHLELLSRLAPHVAPECRTLITDQAYEGAAAFLIDRTTGPKLLTPVAPKPCNSQTMAECWHQLAARYPGAALFYPNQTNRSFVHAAVQVSALLQSPAGPTTVVGSYSPSSHSLAAVIINQ